MPVAFREKQPEWPDGSRLALAAPERFIPCDTDMTTTFHQPTPMRASMGRPDKPHVLIVDDEPQILELLQELLEDEGYRVDCAADGRQAMRIIERETPSLVISDLMMPRLSGYELVRWIHDRHEGPKPHVVLMSAARESGPSSAIPFVRKPFDIDEMLDIVNDVFQSRAS